MISADLQSVAPEFLLALAGCVLLLLDAFLPRLRGTFTALSLVTLGAAGWLLWDFPNGISFGGLLESTPVTAFASLIILASTGLALVASHGYLRREGILAGDYHALVLWSACGMLLMLRSMELLTVFVSLELLSLCLYALAAYNKRVRLGSEAALKYFLMGAFASAFVLYGIALVYGATGSTELTAIAAAFAGQEGLSIASLGILLLISGFGFKMSLVPFHAWSPDTYQGAPSPFVAFLSVAPKAASAVILVKILATVFPEGLGVDWPAVIGALAVASMVVGNLLALVQDDIKRMLAYSGIGHMGYLLIPMASLDDASWTPILVYLAAYALMNAAAFAVISALYRHTGERHLISELAGRGYRHPVLGASLAIAMLSLAGIPPTVGFIGKYLVFLHAVGHGMVWLAVVGVIASLVGVFYYLRVVYTLYMQDEPEGAAAAPTDRWGQAAALLAALGILILGLLPALLTGWMG